MLRRVVGHKTRFLLIYFGQQDRVLCPVSPAKNRVFSSAHSTVRDQFATHDTKFLALECAMCQVVAGVRQRLPLAASRGIPHDGGHFTHSRGAGRTARRQWAFHDPEVGTGFDLGGG